MSSPDEGRRDEKRCRDRIFKIGNQGEEKADV